MKQTKQEFVEHLEELAREQRKIVETMITPPGLHWLSRLVAFHPWSLIIPCAVLIYFSLWFIVGKPWTDFILGIFGGFS